MNNSLVKKLMDFGLGDKEAKVYLALLELELATVNEVAKSSGINRSSTYVVLESLKKKGLVGISDDKNVRRYVATSPESLLQTAEEKARKQEEVKRSIESIVPELKALHKDTKQKPKVRVYEGTNGIKEVYWDILNPNTKELRTYANPVNLIKYVPDFMKQDEERGKRGIKMYAINPATKEIMDLQKRGIGPHQPYEMALIPEEKFKFSSDMGIYEDKVAFVSPKEKFGIIIENGEIADMIKNNFNLAWEEAKRLDKEIRKKHKIK
jgi:HTH-type transcriptional regulator, sugar sensing transcriptional regulator